MKKHFWAVIILWAISFSALASAADELVISEIVNGFWTNKAIELCNPSSKDANFAITPYAIEVYRNGAPPPRLLLLDSGTVPAGGSFVQSSCLARRHCKQGYYLYLLYFRL
jgi:hypothetical protein